MATERHESMQIASALSTMPTADETCADIERQLRATLGDARIDLLLLFITSEWTTEFSTIVASLRTALHATETLAVIAESVLGTDREVERTAAVSAMAFYLSSGRLTTFHMAEDEWRELLTDEETLTDRITAADEGEPVAKDALRSLLFLADPFTTPIVQLLEACSLVFPRAPVIGGMASGIKAEGETQLALNGAIHTSGLVGVAFSGDIDIDCVVSQGCRPIGETFEITRAHENVIEELNGKQPLAAIEQMVEGLPLHDQQLIATGGLQIGRVIDAGKGNLGPGDFLLRSLIAVKRETGAIVIGDRVHAGETLQFHVRDAKTADEEMRLLLEGEMLLASPDSAVGVLLITCNGRGTRLFNLPHHDVTLTRQVLGPIPVAGFFAAGELGAVNQKNFIHGHTAVLAVFREAAAP
jgi:small ligand-binding sensory domain FIST